MAEAKHEQKRAGAAAAAAAAVAGGDDMDGDEAPVKLNEDFRNVIIIDNIPQVGAEKFAKLSEFVKRTFAAFGTIVPDGFILPTQGTPAVTCGYAFVEYANADMAARALAEGDNKRFDKDHVLRVTLYSDFDKLVNMSEEYVPPPKPEFEAKSNPNGWLLDREGRDQFLMRFNMFEHKQLRHETHVYWSDPLNRPSAAEGARELAYDGAREKQRGKSWCEMYTAWSPRGTYLATFHHQGIVLWSGDDFQKFGRYAHAGVKVIDFSPCEKYLVTSTYNERQMKDERWVIVWDVVKQTELRTFDAGGTMAWPSFHWSVDDKYLARVAPDVVQVFETPHMGLLDKKSVKVPGVRECQMSPSDNYVSYWVPEREQTTAVVALMALPSRKVVREKHVYFVTDVRMHWQQAGDFLCCKVSRRQKKKAMPTMFLVFRLRAKDVPIEEFEINETIHAFAWDPKGARFAVAHGDLPGGRTNVSFYNISKKKVELQKTLEGKTCNGLYWSPAGTYVILAGMGALGGVLEFVDATTATTVASTDHYQLTDVDWSPCGRYAITSSSQPLDPGPNFKATIENGYKLWNMQGRLLLSKPVETLYQAMWRPRPPSMLTAAQKEEKYLRDKYWDKFSKEDEKRRQSQLSGVEDERRQLKEQWKAMRADHMKDYNEEAPMRVELRGGLLSDEEEDFVTIETVFEEEVSRTEEVISNKDFAAESKAAKARAAGRGPAAAAAAADDEDAVAEDD